MWTQNQRHQWTTIVALVAMIGGGCNHSRNDVSYLGDAEHQYYRGQATEVDFPTVTQVSADKVIETQAPHTIRDLESSPIREVTLMEAVHASIENSEIIRTAGTFLSTGNQLYTNPDRINSVFDPAIQETGVLFGGRGVEAALSAFDAQFSTGMVWGRDRRITNTAGFPSFASETGQFNATLAKSFAYGGSASVSHRVDYLGRTNLAGGFPSSYSGVLDFQYRQPLLAGSGTEYTRTAGPIGQAFGGLTGVSQGVLIARINNDLTIADFQASVRNLVKDVEDTYWDLYLAYRTYHTAKTAYEAALGTWRTLQVQLELGAGERVQTTQAQDQLFAAEAASNNARSAIYTTEVRLRRLMGLPVNDGTTLRPADEPVSAELVPDWNICLAESLIQRVELRRQKWNIKSLELQLSAAQNLVRPRLDFVGGYTVNGFGDDLLAYNDGQGVPASDNVNSLYQNMTGGDQTAWNLGFQFEMPLGLRSAKAQVSNYELRLAKARKVLQEQEHEISLELAAAFQEVARAYKAAEINLNRLQAAFENVKYYNLKVDGGVLLPDEVLRSQERQAQAEVAYYTSLVDYNKALVNLEFRKGTLLDHNGIRLAEGGWEPGAYEDARYHYNARAHAKRARWKGNYPEPFAFDAPVGGAYVGPAEPGLIDPEAEFMLQPTEAPQGENQPADKPAAEYAPAPAQ